jgi:methyl-accepting chemotaxis protein
MTKIATAIVTGSPKSAAKELVNAIKAQLGDDEPQFLSVFASTAQPLGEVMPGLVEAFPHCTIIGSGAGSGEFTETSELADGVSAFAVAGDYQVFAGFGGDVSKDLDGAAKRALANQPTHVDGYPHRTAVLVMDTLSSGCGDRTVDVVQKLLGEKVPLAGGSAGDDLKMKETLVALGSRVDRDAIVLVSIFSKKPLGVGVAHGHNILSRPLKVTKVTGNVVHELDGKPAWQVWREEAREDALRNKIPLDSIPREELAMHFLPLYEGGIAAGNEFRVRAPLTVLPDDSLFFATIIPQGTMIRVMQTGPQRQISSAKKAAARAKDGLGPNAVAGALVFDCACRKMSLKNGFHAAVKAISTELGEAKVAGFETYGEFALTGDDATGFHNSTSVVLAFPR